tara:strand:- start:589 stop:1002 length:414 start_codon:yes stop_codon:yes gene_type:complete
MNIFKRYSISLGIAGLFLYFFSIWVEEKKENIMPHNLTTKKEEEVSITLLPKRYHEKCIDLSSKNDLKYGFNSEMNLSFNLHYHDEGEKFFVVEEESINSLDKIFNPQKRGYYCLMWINTGQKENKTNYFFKILKRS